jgi:hypothetical protein
VFKRGEAPLAKTDFPLPLIRGEGLRVRGYINNLRILF